MTQAKLIFAISGAAAFILAAAAGAPRRAPASPASHENAGVDVRDLVEHRASELPELGVVYRKMRTHPQWFFPPGVRMTRRGPGLSPETRVNAVYGVELLRTPRRYAQDRTTDFFLVALLHAEGRGFLFRSFQIRTAGSPRRVTGVHIYGDHPLSKARFSVRVSLVDRKVIVTEERTGMRKVYPIGVGGVDFGATPMSRGRTMLLTPLYRRATLDRSTALEAREEPAHFQGMPFLRISRRDGEWTPIAFHVKQNPKLIRGFLSHGCLRMRERDLYELHALLMHGDAASVPVDILLKSDRPEDAIDHPYPLHDRSFKRVKNLEADSNRPSRIERDEDNLLVMDRVRGRAPLDAILGVDGLDGDTLTREESRQLAEAAEVVRGWQPENLLSPRALRDWNPSSSDAREKTRREDAPPSRPQAQPIG